MKIPIYQVDAFTSVVFSGNPAAVCLLDEWIDDRRLQAIAISSHGFSRRVSAYRRTRSQVRLIVC